LTVSDEDESCAVIAPNESRRRAQAVNNLGKIRRKIRPS
jgi:hypothetical protein